MAAPTISIAGVAAIARPLGSSRASSPKANVWVKIITAANTDAAAAYGPNTGEFMMTTTSSACSTGPANSTPRAGQRLSSSAASPAGSKLTSPSATSTPVTACSPKPRSLPTRSRKLKVIDCTSPMHAMPTMPHHTAAGMGLAAADGR